MINVHHSRGLSTCTHQLLANRASARCVTGVKGGRAAPEAATVQECCGRRASPPSCDLLGTLHEPKGRGEACGFVLVFFTSPPQILYCFSGKLLSASAGVLFVAQPVQFAKKKKKDSCVTMNQQMDFFCWVLSSSCVVGGQEMNSWASQCCLPGASDELPPIVQCLKCCEGGYFQEKASPSDRCGTPRSQGLHWGTWEQLLARAKPSPRAGEWAECGSAERAGLVLG